ncbi:MAG: enolase C-terminal domain-like protein [Nesterenkonia sp.]
MSSEQSLVIRRTHAIQYRMPLNRPFGTSRHVITATTNLLVRVHAEVDGHHLMGVGEAQPRNKLTGDINTNKAWQFFMEASESLQGAQISLASPGEARATIRDILKGLGELAQRRSTKANRDRPFRGSLLGLEIALLDLAAQALNVPMTELLGGARRPQVAVTASTISTEVTAEELRTRIARQARRNLVNRVKGRGDSAKDLATLKVIHSANLSAGTPKMVWMDVNEGFSPETARTFVADLAAGIAAGELPEAITLEQPVPKSNGDQLPELQREADRLTTQQGTGDIRIMPDESLWDIHDLEHLHRLGGCRAINIKTAKAGGLIASLDTAERAVELNPDTYVYIGAMIGTSDITTWASLQLAQALPRIDYFTAMPPGNVAARISDPLTKLDKDSNVHQNSPLPGLGAALAYDKLAPYIVKHKWYPTPAESPLMAGVNTYPVDHVRGFGEMQTDNHILEKEALALGLDTVRTSPVDFMGIDASGKEISFSWTKSTMSSTAAMGITVDKQTTRDLLRDAGVPTPRGRRFHLGDVDAAVQYADSIGYPVVFKPLRGTGGRGVIPGIADANELRWAFEQGGNHTLSRAGVVVEEHLVGREFRILALQDKALSAVEKRPGEVEGDGDLTIAELMLQKHTMRMHNPHLRLRRIKFDERNHLQLARQNMTFDTVLPPGEKATYTISPSFHLGGESVEMLSELHPSIAEAAANAVRAVPSLGFAGVDFIVADPAAPLTGQRAGILELNSSPAQSSHEFPMRGNGARVSRELLRFVARESGMTLAESSRQELHLRLLVRGRFIRTTDAMRRIAEKAKARNLSGWVRSWGIDLLECEISGTTDEAASLISSLTGRVQGFRVGSVETEHLQHSHTGDFEVRS